MVLRDSRFFVPEPIGEATSLILDGSEAHHLLHVLRGDVGDCVTLFDDSDHEYQATIIGLEKKRVQLRIESRTFRSVESNRRVIVASAVPKGDRQQLLMETLGSPPRSQIDRQVGTLCCGSKQAMRPESPDEGGSLRHGCEALARCR